EIGNDKALNHTITVHNPATGESSIYTIANTYNYIRHVFIGLSPEKLAEATNPENITMGTNGGYSFLTEKGMTMLLPFQSQPFDAYAIQDIPWSIYPPDAPDVKAIQFGSHASNFTIEAYVNDKGSGGIIRIRRKGDNGLYSKGNIPETEKTKGTLITAALYGNGSFSRFNVDWDYYTTGEARISVISKADPDLWPVENSLPIMSPKMNDGSIICVQVGQSVTIPFKAKIYTYGDYKKADSFFREKYPDVWYSGEGGTLAMQEGLYGYGTIDNRVIAYGAYDDVTFSFHDQLYLDVDGKAEPAENFLKIEAEEDFWGNKALRLTGLKQMPRGTSLTVKGKTSILGESATVRIRVLGENITSIVHTTGSAITTKPRAIGFKRNVKDDELGSSNPPMFLYGGLSDLTARVAAGYSFGLVYGSAIAMPMMMLSDFSLQLLNQLIQKDGDVRIVWHGMLVENAVRYRQYTENWAISLSSPSLTADDGVGWFIGNASLNNDGSINLPHELGSLRNRRGTAFPAIMGNIKTEATLMDFRAFFAHYPEFLPLLGGDATRVAGRYGPYALEIAGRTVDGNFPMKNSVMVMCFDSPNYIPSLYEPKGRGDDATDDLSDLPNTSKLPTSYAYPVTSGDSAGDEKGQWVVFDPMEIVASDDVTTVVDTDAEGKLMFSLSSVTGTIDCIVPTILGVKSIEVKDTDGNAVFSDASGLDEDLDSRALLTASTMSARSRASSNSNRFVIEFVAPSNAIDDIEITDLYFTLEGDSTIYSTSFRGDGLNGGFALGKENTTGSLPSGVGCSSGFAAAALLCVALFPLRGWRKK
ncbi:hypothetical protein LJC31_08515, partial [Synergistaceae bacterium OttesenSCG-928-I11]|nr:hypothetical protein [Synergistaceae bacterium OttesenSCG-928-I11]